jgi:hypothetical protein
MQQKVFGGCRCSVPTAYTLMYLVLIIFSSPLIYQPKISRERNNVLGNSSSLEKRLRWRQEKKFIFTTGKISHYLVRYGTRTGGLLLKEGQPGWDGSGKYSTGLKIRWSIFYYEKQYI